MALVKENAYADGLTPRFRKKISLFEAGPWAEAYEDRVFSELAPLSALVTLDDYPKTFLNPPTSGDPDDFQRWLDAVWDECERFLDDDSDDDLAFMDTEEVAPPWASPLLGEHGLLISRQAVLLESALVLVYNYFSCMVHRKSLYELVVLAKMGEDEAMLKVVQIDKSCLTDIPHFKERMEKAGRDREWKFLKRVDEQLQKPIFHGGTKLNSLYLVFSLLESIGLLDAYAKDKERFADFCQSLGIYGPENDVVDVGSFEKTFFRFKKQYQRVKRNSKISLFVKDTD